MAGAISVETARLLVIPAIAIFAERLLDCQALYLYMALGRGDQFSIKALLSDTHIERGCSHDTLIVDSCIYLTWPLRKQAVYVSKRPWDQQN